ncbi:MAG: hypothetical protein QXZ41_03815 [Ignisphaera sp.]|uniref:Uncharacterized protein n=1 Tax=Ignisphaera aggregans TaxID=334771 RepID=A0A7C4JJ05_9CREN
MVDTVKLIVAGSRPEDIIRCTLIATKARKYIKRYTNVQILFMPNINGFSGIVVEDEAFVECNDEEESIEQIIYGITRLISKKKFMDLAVAAAYASDT